MGQANRWLELPAARAIASTVLCETRTLVMLAAAIFAAAAVTGFLRRARRIDREVRERYYLSACGFLMSAAPTPLPPRFAAWEAIAMRLPELNRSGELLAQLERLPVLSVAAGELDDAQLRRARVLLTCLVHSAMFGRRVPWRQLRALPAVGQPEEVPSERYEYVAPCETASNDAMMTAAADTTAVDDAPVPLELPTQLATPWRQVSAMLQMPLVLTVTDTDLWNAAPGLEGLPQSEWVPRFRQIFSMTATRSERGFHAVPHAINRALAPLVPQLMDAPRLLARSRTGALCRLCAGLEAALRDAKALLQRIYDEVGVGEFYDVYRSLLSGFTDGLRLPASPPLPGVLVKPVGPSAGQTAVLILVDIVLGVEHGPKLAAFQAEMRAYMPAPHAELLGDVERRMRSVGTLQAVATAAGAPPRLHAAYAAACTALAALRACHMGIATHFLRRALKGTGGSDFRSLLREGLASTRDVAGDPASRTQLAEHVDS